MGNNGQVNDNQIKNNERRGRGLFYGIIATATFIVMAVGATFAYFAATASSANTSITTGSTSLSLDLLSYETAWSRTELIPVNTYIAKYSFEQQDDTTRRIESKTCYNASSEEVDCESSDVDDSKTVIKYVEGNNNTMCVDDYGNAICSVYVFQVINDNASPQTMTFKLVSESNGFSNLAAMAYEISAPSEFDEDGTENPDYAIYNSDANNNKTWEPGNEGFDEFIVKNGNTQVFDYTPVYVNRKGVTKKILNYTETAVDGSSTTTVEAKERVLDKFIDEPSNDNLVMRTTEVANGISIAPEETKTFAIVLYINNLAFEQKEDENQTYTGSIQVTTGDGSGVSGYISLAKAEEEGA